MSNIDQRIVDMQFNNQQFENNMKTTMNSLDNLKKGLSGMDDAGKKFSLDGIAAGVETIADKFSLLGLVGITALQSIMTKAIDAGIAITKSLTLDPLIGGFSEYETKLNAIQTIMVNTANKGTTMKQVTAALEELNKYADQTIYSFSTMTENIGRFTASGVGLEDSVSAIKGISNLAAGAGSSANQAAAAMYNLSQSISAGGLMLQDWNSVVNAGMGGPYFQNAILDAAVAMGELDEATRTAVQSGETSFRALISGKDRWIASSEVLLKALGKMSTDETLLIAATQVKTFTQLRETLQESIESGWAETWETVIGDKDEAVAVWTAVNNAIEGILKPMENARNEVLGLWKDMGGRDVLLKSLASAFEGLSTFLKPIGDAFSQIFSGIDAKQLFDLTTGFANLMDKFRLSEEGADKLRRVFAGLFAAVDILIMTFGGLFGIFKEVLSVMSPVGDGLFDLMARFGDFTVALRDSMKETEFWTKAAENIGNGLRVIIDIMSKFISDIQTDFTDVFGPAEVILENFKEFLSNVGDGIKIAIDKIGEYLQGFNLIDLNPLQTFSTDVEYTFKPFTFIANMFKSGMETIVKVWEWAAPVVVPLAKVIGNAIGGFAKAFGTAITSGDFQTFLNLLNTGIITTILLSIKSFISELSGFSGKASGILDSITGVLDGVRESLEAYQMKLKAQALLTIAAAVGVLVGALWILSGIDPVSLTTGLGAITVLFVELSAVMLVLSKHMGSVKMGAVAAQMIAISVAVLILSVAMKSLAELSWEDIVKGAASIAGLMFMLTQAADALSKNSGKLISSGIGLIAFAAAIVILASAMEKLGALDVITLAKGLASVGVLMAEVAGFTHIVKPEKLLSTGVAMTAMGAALVIMSNAVSTLGALSVKDLIKGLIGLAAILASVAGFTQIVNPEKLLGTSIAMIAMGAALKIIASAISDLGALSLEELAKGIIAMAASLAVIAGFSQIVNPVNMLASSVALLAVGAALLIIAQAIQSFGSMTWEEIGKGLVVLAGALLILGVAMYGMMSGLPGAAAMLVMAAAIAVLTPALMALGSMDLEEIGLALLALVGVFTVVGVAGLVLAPLTPVILGLAAAIALLGVGVLAIGVGLLAFATALGVLATAGAAGAAALVIIITSIVELIPTIVEAVGEGLILLFKTVAEGTPILMEAIKAIVLGIIQILVELAPPLVTAVMVFLDTLLKTLLEYVPKLLDTGMKLLIAILDGIAKNIKDIVVLALKIVEEFLRGIAEGVPGMAKAGMDIVIAFIRAIGEEYPRLIDAGFKMIIDFVNGLADAIRENTDPLIESFANLADAMIEGLVKGIFGGVDAAVNAVKKLGGGIIDGFKNLFGIASPSKVMNALALFLTEGVSVGLKAGTAGVVSSTETLGSAIIDGFSGNEDLYKKTGSEASSSFASGILGMAGEVVNAGINVGKEALSGINDAISKISDAFAEDFDMAPTITPVLDLSEIQNGSKSLNKLLSGSTSTTPVTATVNRISSQMAGKSDTTDLANGENTGGTTYKFEQNNYSPKALTRLELYRQTKNQFAQLKEEVEGA